MIAKTLLLLACTVVLGCSTGTEQPAAESYAWTGLKVGHAGLFTNDCADYAGDYHGSARCALGVSVPMKALQRDLPTLPDDQARADLERAVGAWLAEWDAFEHNVCFSHETAPECANEPARLRMKQTTVTDQIDARVGTEQKPK